MKVSQKLQLVARKELWGCFEEGLEMEMEMGMGMGNGNGNGVYVARRRRVWKETASV